MITSCKALFAFGFEFHMRESRQWSLDVLSALQGHCDALERLALHGMQIYDDEVKCSRLDGFERLHYLRHLHVTFPLLMGKPAGHRDGNGRWVSDPGWEGYPAIWHVLPPNLESLHLDISVEPCPRRTTTTCFVLSFPPPRTNFTLAPRWS